jgi:trigger factor
MKTSLEDISSVRKKLSIEIDSQEVDNNLSEAYRELGKKAAVPGFRPGKVPRRILERRFGDQVADDVTRNLINRTLPMAIEEVKTFPLGEPLLEKEALKQGQDFRYSAVMEVRPQFELNKYLGLEVEKEQSSVSEEDVQNRLEQIRETNGKLTSIDQERPIKEDDYVVLDYEGFEGDQPLDGIKSLNFLLKVGKNDFHPKFEEALIGLNPDDEAEINVDFEEDYPHSKLAGKNVIFKVKITGIKELVIPELDDEFARNLGAEFKDLADLTNKVREAITAQEERRIDGELKQRLIQKISESVDFELPQVLVESELEYSIGTLKQNIVRSGSNLEKAGLSEEKLRKDLRPASEKRAKEMLILGEIAKKDNIVIEEEDLANGFKELAASSGQDPETLRKYYESRDLVDALRQQLVEEKTLNYLVEHAKIVQLKDKKNKNNPKEESK